MFYVLGHFPIVTPAYAVGNKVRFHQFFGDYEFFFMLNAGFQLRQEIPHPTQG